ncbi:polysaccharide deacetylase family protein [Chitinophaga caseinilytica]|uniref:Polysaccharide deacetylase family protein n=1 Tax=Chitinophaga caseinilytica TaxID=2267521 RepID=A0ABZ2YY28_9BACT
MSIAKQLFYRAASLTPVSFLQKAAARPLLLPYQHLVSDREVPYISPIYPFKDRKAFAQDLDYLLRHFRPVTLGEVVRAMKGGDPLPKGAFLLTFDDGLREIAEIVAPMLQAKGVPAVFFLNPAYLGNKTHFYRFKLGLMLDALRSGTVAASARKAAAELLGAGEEGLESAIQGIGWRRRALADELGGLFGLDFEGIFAKERPYMDHGEVEGLVRAGFSLGGHSMEHPYYQELTLDEQVAQTLASVDAVCGQFGEKERVFAFPHSDEGVSRAFFSRVLEGEGAVDLIFGTANHQADIDPRILQRFNSERPDIPIGDCVKGILLLEALRKASGRNLVTRS